MKQLIFTLSLTLALILPACNLPEDPAVSQDFIMTAAAMTVDAALQMPLPTPTAPPSSTSSPDAAPPPSAPGTISATPELSGTAMASVGDVINCRSGPGVNYERITQILPSSPVQITGFFPPNYWIVNSDKGPCWLSGEFATPIGAFKSVPTVTAPPTPEGEKPEAPTFPKNGWTFLCYGPGQVDIVLNWNDKADDETGYRIIRNGEVAVELPANATNFSETIPLNSGQTVNYQIQAYNQIGTTNSSTASITCP